MMHIGRVVSQGSESPRDPVVFIQLSLLIFTTRSKESSAARRLYCTGVAAVIDPCPRSRLNRLSAHRSLARGTGSRASRRTATRSGCDTSRLAALAPGRPTDQVPDVPLHYQRTRPRSSERAEPAVPGPVQGRGSCILLSRAHASPHGARRRARRVTRERAAHAGGRDIVSRSSHTHVPCGPARLARSSSHTPVTLEPCTCARSATLACADGPGALALLWCLS